MKLSVKLHGPNNSQEIPEEWPDVVRELDDKAEVPEGLLEMTVSEYNAYRALHRHKYDEWYRVYREPKEQARDAYSKKLSKMKPYFEMLQVMEQDGDTLSTNERAMIKKYKDTEDLLKGVDL